jgi:peptidyl-prolyl cis-trans isomerase SurA
VRPLLAVLLLVVAAATAGAAGIDTVAAVVNGHPITASEVSREEAFVAATGLTPVDPGIVEEPSDVLSQMILALLMRQRAEVIGVAVEDGEIDAAIARVADNNGITAAQLEGKLSDADGTWERFRGRLSDRLLQPRLLDREVLGGTIVTEAEVAAEYEARPERFRRPAQLRVSHLLLPVPAGAAEEQVASAEGKVAAAKERLAAGTPLADLVAELAPEGGSGGDLGWFTKGELHPALEEAVLALPDGASAGPVRTGAGIHLVTVTGHRDEEVTPLAEAGPVIVEEIHRRKVDAALRGYVGKLKAEAIIRFPK